GDRAQGCPRPGGTGPVLHADEGHGGPERVRDPFVSVLRRFHGGLRRRCTVHVRIVGWSPLVGHHGGGVRQRVCVHVWRIVDRAPGPWCVLPAAVRGDEVG